MDNKEISAVELEVLKRIAIESFGPLAARFVDKERIAHPNDSALQIAKSVVVKLNAVDQGEFCEAVTAAIDAAGRSRSGFPLAGQRRFVPIVKVFGQIKTS